jgi:hypothetical protein
MKKQRGAALADMQLALAISLLLCVFVLAVGLQFYRAATFAASVHNAVQSAARAAQHHYLRQVESTRCLSASAPSIAALISGGLLLPEVVQGHPFTISITYTLSPAFRPVRMDILVTFQTQDLAKLAISQLQPAQVLNPTTISFNHALFPAHPSANEWSNFNLTTRCYE